MPTVHHPRRALLFMPGDSVRKIAKAMTLDADSIVMDLEDGVAFSQKETARAVVLASLQTLDFGRRERVVRLNPVGSGLEPTDLAATVAGRPDAYMLPKVHSPEHLVWLDSALAKAEAEHGWEVGQIRILALIETALGVMNLAAIAQASPRLQALLFGAEDLAADIGAVRTRSNSEVQYARSAVVTAAAAYGLQAIDMVFTDLADKAGLAVECRQAVELGYQGKMAIHPRQTPIIQTAFSPTPAQLAAAQRLVDAYRAHQAAGAGVFVLTGRMVDAPMLAAAEKGLARAVRQ